MISGGDIELGMQSTLIPMNIAHEDEAQSELPPGFRFHPTDEELVTHYLTKKILDSTFSGRAIGEADLNKCEPWDLLEKAKMGEKEWYFFGLRDRKFTRGLRINRTTEAGYWKTTGKDREVLSSVSSALIGMKKTLVFLKGRAPKGEKTNWLMHEYRLEGKFSDHHLPKNCKLDDWVVCRIFEKSAGGRSSTGLMRRNAYLDLPGSPSLPTLLKSPFNKTAVNDQETRSSESDSGTSAKIHDVSFFSKLMEPVANLTGHHLHQFQCGSSSSYADTSDQLSEVGRLMKHSSYMHNDLNDPRTYMNMIPTATPSSVSNMGCDQISVILDKQPGIQQLPGLPSSIIYNPHMPLPSNSSNLGFTTDAYFSALHPSDAVSKGLVSQFTLRATEPSFISCVHHSVGVSNNNNSMGLNNSVHNFQWGEDFSGDMNDEMTYALCSRLD